MVCTQMRGRKYKKEGCDKYLIKNQVQYNLAWDLLETWDGKRVWKYVDEEYKEQKVC